MSQEPKHRPVPKEELFPLPPLPVPKSSTSKIIESYETLLKSLNEKLGQLTTDLELTREKLSLAETRYMTLLSLVGEGGGDVEKLLDTIDDLEKKLINKNAELNRCKAKLLQYEIDNADKSSTSHLKEKEKGFGKSEIGKYFNFESIREDEAILGRKRKNSVQEQYNSVPWEKAYEEYADDISSPTKFKQKTFPILKKFIPHEQRPKVWPFIFENPLGLTPTLYIELLERQQKSPIEPHVRSQILRDIHRSFNFKVSVEDKEMLKVGVQEVLESFHFMRPDVSYVQGMTYPVIILVAVVGKINAFRIFSNLVLCNKFFRNLYTFEDGAIQIYCKVFESLLKEYLPEVEKHVEMLGIKCEIFLIEWFFTIFSRGLSLETTLKIWDLLGYERETVLYRLCLAIFELVGKRLVNQNYEETVHLIQSYWSYVDENKLLELVVNSKLTNEKLSKLFSKITKQVHSKLA